MREITQKEFEQSMLAGEPMIVDFWAEWCGPCKIMGPMLEQLSEAYEGSVSFYKSNVDAEPDFAKRFNVMSIPTLVMFKEGQKLGSIVGAMGPDKIVNKINETFGFGT